MADRRMFAKSVVLTSVFKKLPVKVQLLYYHLGMLADDDGFVADVDVAMMASRATWKEMEQLVAAGYLYHLEKDVVLIRHWFTHNTIRKDRYRETVYVEERDRMILHNRVYQLATDWQPSGNQPATDWQPSGNQLATQMKLKENKRNENKINQVSPAPVAPRGADGGGGSGPAIIEILCYIAGNGLRVNGYDFQRYYEERDWMEGGQPVRDWRKLLDTWERRNYGTGTP